jgi:hypothetical protein
VFSPLTRNYAQTVGRPDGEDDRSDSLIPYYLRYVKTDGLCKDRRQLVVLIRRLAHPVNTYADTYVNRVVSEVNGMPIGDIRDLKRALARPKDGFHVIRFLDTDETLVVDRAAAEKAAAEILAAYGVAQPEYVEPAP